MNQNEWTGDIKIYSIVHCPFVYNNYQHKLKQTVFRKH